MVARMADWWDQTLADLRAMQLDSRKAGELVQRLATLLAHM